MYPNPLLRFPLLKTNDLYIHDEDGTKRLVIKNIATPLDIEYNQELADARLPAWFASTDEKTLGSTHTDTQLLSLLLEKYNHHTILLQELLDDITQLTRDQVALADDLSPVSQQTLARQQEALEGDTKWHRSTLRDFGFDPTWGHISSGLALDRKQFRIEKTVHPVDASHVALVYYHQRELGVLHTDGTFRYDERVIVQGLDTTNLPASLAVVMTGIREAKEDWLVAMRQYAIPNHPFRDVFSQCVTLANR